MVSSWFIPSFRPVFGVAKKKAARLGFGTVKHEELVGPGVEGRKVRAFHDGLGKKKKKKRKRPDGLVRWVLFSLFFSWDDE